MNEWTKKVTYKIEENCWLISEHHSSDNGCSFAVIHNRHMWFNLPNLIQIDDDDLIDHLESDETVKGITDQIRKDYKEYHDGSNFVREFNDYDNKENIQELEVKLNDYFEDIDNYPHGKEIWDANEWLYPSQEESLSEYCIGADTTDDELDEIIKKHESGDAEVSFESGSFERWAYESRDELVEEEEED